MGAGGTRSPGLVLGGRRERVIGPALAQNARKAGKFAATPALQAPQRIAARWISEFHLVKAEISMSRVPVVSSTSASPRCVIVRTNAVIA